MMDSEITRGEIKRTLQRIAHIAEEAAMSSRGHVPSKSIIALALELEGLRATLEAQEKHEGEMEAREGVETPWGDGKRVVFAWRKGQHQRTAEVYPNAHNKGATYGLKTFERIGFGGTQENFHGANWDLGDARAAAKAWAHESTIPVHPLKIIREVMDR